MKNKERIKELVDLINKWNSEYFDEDNPSVSDRVYDTHLKELVELEKKYPNLILDNSPTKNIGANLSKSKFKKVKHDKLMLSLNKAYSFEELNKFFSDISDVIKSNDINFLIQPKIDGLSISLKYENGELIQAITRGDGQIGEDVTDNVKNIINDIPVKINYFKPIEVRGEIYISHSNFLKILESENVEYANARNLASGTLRQLNNEIVKQRNLSSFIYDIVDFQKHNISNQKELVSFLLNNKFPFPSDYLIENIIKKENIFEYILEFESKKRKSLGYDIDGMVIKLNEMKFYDEIGYTSKFPKYAIAYKFDEELIQTTLEDIFVSIGRTGIATYNAKLKPVLLLGTTVSAATMHNYNYVNDLGVNIGDEVTIKKAGEIIPKVVEVSIKKSNGIFPKIMFCPSCNSQLFDTKTHSNQVCLNKNCPEINIRRIIHFASKQALNIEGLGEGIVRRLYELNFLKKIEDIFFLEKFKDKIIEIKGFGLKFWSNLWNGIVNSYNVELQNLIFALGIPQLGIKNAKSIAKKIKQFDQLFSLNEENLLSIDDIGEVTIKEFFNYINKEENLKLFNFLISIGINPIFNENKEITIPFFNSKTFVISGTFELSRDELKKIIEDNGGNTTSTVSKKTYALLLGENGGSKIDKAKKLGIRIIDKKELNEILSSS